jgi:hypothetical protein
LSRNSLSLITRGPTTLVELNARLAQALSALSEAARPTAAARLGVRCIVRRPVADAEDCLVHAPLAGLAGAFPLAHHSASEIHLPIPEGSMAIRHAKLPPGASYADGIIMPGNEPSWILDVDAYSGTTPSVTDLQKGAGFSSIALSGIAQALGKRAAHVVDGCLVEARGANGETKPPITRH